MMRISLWATVALVGCGAELVNDPDGNHNDAEVTPDADADGDSDADVTNDTLTTDDAESEQPDPTLQCPESSGGALELDGIDEHVTMGPSPGLGLDQFTLEAWVSWSGEGWRASSGVGGIGSYPIIAKGRGESDGSTVDCNYLFGIEEHTHTLAADFEDMASGANHPVRGATPLVPSMWYHVAVTYDGSTWSLYLDGELDGEATVDATPRHDSIQHFALGTALNSSGTASGAFGGLLDEARVWNYARSAEEIAEGLLQEISDAEGLVARWALDNNANDALGVHHGTVVGGAWVEQGAPFAVVDPLESPTLISPAEGATVDADGARLAVWLEGSDDQESLVSFWGREVGEDFSVVVLPDTQYYSQSYPELFIAQTEWVMENAEEYNIRAVLHAGDISQNGDTYGEQWINAEAAMSVLETPLPGLPDGMPYGLAVGNHDQTPLGDPLGSTTLFNQYFGVERFADRSYYGGHYDDSNDNHFILFEAGMTQFLALFLEFDPGAFPDVLDWAAEVIDTHPQHRVLVTVHYLIGTGDPAAWGSQGEATYLSLRDHSEIDLMLCGHVPGEGRRVDTYSSHDIHTLLADYQSREHGGDGWLRVLEFSPADASIHVQTYSPVLDQWETDTDSDFFVPWEPGDTDLVELARLGPFTGGGEVRTEWRGLETGALYQWFAEVETCFATATTPYWSFETR